MNVIAEIWVHDQIPTTKSKKATNTGNQTVRARGSKPYFGGKTKIDDICKLCAHKYSRSKLNQDVGL